MLKSGFTVMHTVLRSDLIILYFISFKAFSNINKWLYDIKYYTLYLFFSQQNKEKETAQNCLFVIICGVLCQACSFQAV